MNRPARHGGKRRWAYSLPWLVLRPPWLRWALLHRLPYPQRQLVSALLLVLVLGQPVVPPVPLGQLAGLLEERLLGLPLEQLPERLRAQLVALRVEQQRAPLLG
jgi:hypothetical protein